MKEYEVKMHVEALCEGDAPNPDTGSFDGSLKYSEDKGGYVFDGTFTSTIFAEHEEQAVSIAVQNFKTADYGDLTDISLDYANINVEANEYWIQNSDFMGPSAETSIIMTNDFRLLGDYKQLFTPTSDYGVDYDEREFSPELLDAAENALNTAWTDSHLSECSIVVLNGELYVELLNEYDNETMESNHLTQEEMFREINGKAYDFARTEEYGPAFDGTTIVVGNHIGMDDLAGGNHELLVFIPANIDNLKERVEAIAEILDSQAYEFSKEKQVQKHERKTDIDRDL